METKLEFILINSYKSEMISYLKSHPEDFEEAIQLAISEKQVYAWRASWLLWSCMDKNDQRIQKYLDKIVEILPSRNENIQREYLIILQNMELKNDSMVKLFDCCIAIWEKIEKKPSVRFNAFKVMVNIVKKHPDLSSEIKFLVDPQYMEKLSATAKKSIYKMLATIS